MERYAQLSSGIVINVIESETDPDGINGEWVACGNAGPGWAYAGGVFSELVEPVSAPMPRRITPIAFERRFSPEELVRIEMAQLDDPTAPMAARQLSAALRVNQRKLLKSPYHDLDDPEVRLGLLMLEAGQLLDAPGRALVILDTTIADGERA
ncbi:MAG: hypothetical protein ABI606_09465 [Rhodoferax sp.]